MYTGARDLVQTKAIEKDVLIPFCGLVVLRDGSLGAQVQRHLPHLDPPATTQGEVTIC